MNSGKEQKASRLLRVIGQIDDRFVNEAMTWRGISSQRKTPWRLLAIAATFAVVLSVFAASLIIGLLQNDPPAELPPVTDELPATPTEQLDALLLSCTQSTAFERIAPTDVDFFDGTLRIAVSPRSTGEIFLSRPLTSAEAATAKKALTSTGPRTDPSAPDGELRVWILLGDGSVASPCLAPSAGNLAPAELFAYSSEYLPSNDFLKLLEVF